MTLKKQHRLEITSERAWDAYTRLEKAVCARAGTVDDPARLLIADYARYEALKEILLADISDRGLGREVNNYRQKYYKPNESIKELRSVTEQQRKLLNELRLTPASRKEEQIRLDDGFSEF